MRYEIIVLVCLCTLLICVFQDYILNFNGVEAMVRYFGLHTPPILLAYRCDPTGQQHTNERHELVEPDTPRQLDGGRPGCRSLQERRHILVRQDLWRVSLIPA